MSRRRQTVFKTPWFSIEKENFNEVKSLRGDPYYRLKSSDGVLVLALTDKKEIVLVKQFRPAIRKKTCEIPSGEVNRFETPRRAAARELHEETGYICKRLQFLGEGRIMVNRNSAKDYMFLGTGAALDRHFKNAEKIKVVLVKPHEFKQWVLCGRFEQLTGLALLLLAEWKLGVRLVSKLASGFILFAGWTRLGVFYVFL